MADHASPGHTAVAQLPHIVLGLFRRQEDQQAAAGFGAEEDRLLRRR
jgi:hypothetical protein